MSGSQKDPVAEGIWDPRAGSEQALPHPGPHLGPFWTEKLRNLGRNLRINNYNLPWLLQAFVSSSCSAGTVTLGMIMSMSFFLILGAERKKEKKNMFCFLLAWMCGNGNSSSGAAGQWEFCSWASARAKLTVLCTIQACCPGTKELHFCGLLHFPHCLLRSKHRRRLRQKAAGLEWGCRRMEGCSVSLWPRFVVGTDERAFQMGQPLGCRAPEEQSFQISVV